MEKYLTYIVQKQDAPVKIIQKTLPCPVLLKFNKKYQCKNAKTRGEGVSKEYYCSAEKCFYKLAYKDI